MKFVFDPNKHDAFAILDGTRERHVRYVVSVRAMRSFLNGNQGPADVAYEMTDFASSGECLKVRPIRDRETVNRIARRWNDEYLDGERHLTVKDPRSLGQRAGLAKIGVEDGSLVY